MDFKKRFLSIVGLSASYLVASVFFRLVPCWVAPSVPNPLYKWSFCSLSSDSSLFLNSIVEFWGYSSSLSTGYILTFFVPFFVLFLVYFFFLRRFSSSKR